MTPFPSGFNQERQSEEIIVCIDYITSEVNLEVWQ